MGFFIGMVELSGRSLSVDLCPYFSSIYLISLVSWDY